MSAGHAGLLTAGDCCGDKYEPSSVLPGGSGNRLSLKMTMLGKIVLFF